LLLLMLLLRKNRGSRQLVGRKKMGLRDSTLVWGQLQDSALKAMEKLTMALALEGKKTRVGLVLVTEEPRKVEVSPSLGAERMKGERKVREEMTFHFPLVVAVLMGGKVVREVEAFPCSKHV